MSRPMNALRPAALLLLLLLAACAAKAPAPWDQPPVRDVLTLPQDLFAYLPPTGGGTLVLSPAVQAEMCRRLLAGHFGPWERTAPPAAGDLFWGLEHFAQRPVYGENLQRRDPAWLEHLRRLALPGEFPNLGRPGIAVAPTSMRVLPTLEPAFADPGKAGEGFPFDYMQNTAVWPGTPLYLSHLSADGAFVLALCRYASGWIPVNDVAFTDPAFQKEYRARPLLAVTRDRVPLRDGSGLFRFEARVGMLLPLQAATAEGYEVLLPVREASGRAALVTARIAPGDAEALPLPATAANVARVASSMLGEPYGWGGLFGHRDCSALLLDLYTPFGLGLPRNSRQQGKAGTVLPLDGLADQDKEALILAKAAPFASLLWKPGHIMLYLGSRGGRAMILHDVWGLRTEESGREGRRLIGRVAVTTLIPGAELPELKRPEGLLLHGLRSLVLLAPFEPPDPDAP